MLRKQWPDRGEAEQAIGAEARDMSAKGADSVRLLYIFSRFVL